jgi:cell division protease FtsH
MNGRPASGSNDASDQDKQSRLGKIPHWNYWYLIFALLGVSVIHDVWQQYQQVEPLPYSEFIKQLKANNVRDLSVGSKQIEGTLIAPLADGRSRFTTIRVDGDLAHDLENYSVRFEGALDNTLFRDLLSWVVPTLLFFGVWTWLGRRMAGKDGMFGGGLLAIGKSKAKVYVETDVRVGFDDVAGVDEAKDELREVVEFLRDPKAAGRLGGRAPRGILLVGPPGTGKTLLARAVAGESKVPFFSINGSEFVEMFVGVGAARVRDLFEQARLQAPAIIFIDEIDALGRARGVYGGGHDEKEQTLNQLLAELDGFDSSSGLVLLAATNRPEILDPALLRAGRFDRQVLVDRPDKLGRLQILQVHARKIRLTGDINLDQVAAMTPGFSGADLANLVNEAALVATRRKGDAVSLEDFTAAIERIVAGLEKRNRLLNPQERRVVAYHEMGHVLVAAALPGSDPVHKVSIIPRGVGALGYTIQRPTEDRFLMTADELRNKMAVLLGGRAAEEIVFGHLSTGAGDDLVKVAGIAREMVTRYGMSTALGPMAYEAPHASFLEGTLAAPAPREYSEETARQIDLAIRALVDAAYAQSCAILGARRAQLERGAAALLHKETLSEADIRELLALDGQTTPGQAALAVPPLAATTAG